MRGEIPKRVLPLALLVAASAAQAHPSVTQVGPVRPETRQLQTLPSLAPLVQSVKAAVVNVEVRARGPGGLVPPLEGPDPFHEFFEGMPLPGPRIRQGTGSGFIIDPRGLVLTNHHVVADAISIRVRLDDGRELDGRVLGSDPLTDVALVKLEGDLRNLPTVALGDSDAMQVGDWVVAIGNPFGLASSVSLGILSARARQLGAGPFDDFLQTDAAINPGNSGGPLFNARGEVIGIATAIVGEGSGIGFAVPSNLVKTLLPALERGQPVQRGWLGISVQDLTPDLARAMKVPVPSGAVVLAVDEGTPARRAGLRPDDVVVEVNGTPIRSAGELTRIVAAKAPGSTAALTVLRGSRRLQLEVALGTRPDLEGVRRPEPPREEGRARRLGLTFGDLDPQRAPPEGPRQGAVITEVVPGSPAERADLRPGMVVVEAGGKPIRSAEELRRTLSQAAPGSSVLLRLRVPGGVALRALVIPER